MQHVRNGALYFKVQHVKMVNCIFKCNTVYHQTVLFCDSLFAFENKFSKQYKVYHNKIHGNYSQR